jgi:hypothetical protein
VGPRIGRLVFAGLLAALPAGAAIVDRIAATVNDAAIPESEVRKEMVVSALRPEPGESGQAFRDRVLNALIDRLLEYEDAVRFGPAPPDAAEIQDAMDTLRRRLSGEGKNPDEEFRKAGMTVEEVRSSLTNQLVIQRYLKERFSPIAYADTEQAREEYESVYVPEQKAANLPVEPFDKVSDEMRRRYSEKAFAEEVAKWLQGLRQKARISIYRIPVEVPEGRQRVVLSAVPPALTPEP